MNSNRHQLLLGLAALLGFGALVALASQPAAHAEAQAPKPVILAEVADWQGVDQGGVVGPNQADLEMPAGPAGVQASADAEGAVVEQATPSPCIAPPCPVRTPESNGSVTIDRIWTTDIYGYPQTSFRRGDTIQFAARLLNRSFFTQRVLAHFQAAEPGWFPLCELSCPPIHNVFRGYLSVPRGLWTYAVRARTDFRDPVGQWRYRLTITLGGFSQTRETSFRLR